MVVQSLTLQNFRNYQQATFSFSSQITVIIGPNGIGKSNLIEAIFLLAVGKSFRAEKEKQLMQFEKTFCRIAGKFLDRGPVELLSRPTSSRSLRALDGSPSPLATPLIEALEIIFSDTGTSFLKKKYLVNGVARRRVDFAGNLTAVLFTPSDLELIAGQPGIRRRFIDDVLEQVDREYRVSLTTYTKALRQRNALLQQVQETGIRNEKQFAYWDELLINHGSVIAQKRESFLEIVNARQKDFYPCTLIYDKSVISKERLEQYKQAEVGAGVTLVGPQRDDIIIKTSHESQKELVEVRYFASRGQQRLVTLELKLAQIAYMTDATGRKPLLLLDDIFSELDSQNINRILTLLPGYQVIVTTTHKEFLSGVGKKAVEVIELEKHGAV